MTNPGDNGEPNLWANTGNQPVPPSGPGAPAPGSTPPPTPSELPPTTAQPAVPSPADMPPPSGPAGYTTGPGTPPPRQPPLPPTGGPGGPGGPDGPGEPESTQPAWLIPAAVGVVAALIAGGVVFFLTRDDDSDTIATEETTTSLTETTIEAETTLPSETTIESETTLAPETTVAPDTTVAPETTSAPETTAAPETTTAPETTAAPPVDSITAAPPRSAVIAGQQYGLTSACIISPITGYQVTSYLVQDGDPGTIVEQRIDEGGPPFGGYSQFGSSIDVEDFQIFGDEGFGMFGLQGDTDFPIALNPGDVDLGDCAEAGIVTISDPDAPEFGYDYGVVDLCGSSSPLTLVGYLTEGGRVQVTDNGDGTAAVQFDTNDLFLASAPAEALSVSDGRVRVTGSIDGATFDGDTTQNISIDIDGSTPRPCGEFEVR